MPDLILGDRTIELDELGFMVEPDDWTRGVARSLAERNSLGTLSDDHWRIIEYVREYYEEFKSAPMLRMLCKRTKIGKRRVRELFPAGCRDCICLVAGLPEPTG